jgi:hypothetical protein
MLAAKVCVAGSRGFVLCGEDRLPMAAIAHGFSALELFLGPFEGNCWGGFHRHATLSNAAYGFQGAERSRFSPWSPAGILDYQLPSFGPASSHEARIRSLRHNPHSIAALRIVLARSLLRKLCHCPFCGAQRLWFMTG